MNRTAAVLSACLLFACAIAGTAAGTGAAMPVCPITSYPGDDAAKASIATWMAQGAASAGLPGELPVMAALVESGLTNLHAGDPSGGSDTVGYFQMRVDIWNKGDYAGFPERPELQLKWFTDQALLVKSQRIAAGDRSFGSDPATWGEWVADVERPAAQYRGRFQLRLAEASALIASACPGGVPPDTVAPTFKARVERVQDPIKHGGIAIVVRCPLEDCAAVAESTVAVGGAAYVRRVRSVTRTIARGAGVRLKLRFERRLIRRIKRALQQRHRARAAVKVTVRDAAGNAASARRKVRLKRAH